VGEERDGASDAELLRFIDAHMSEPVLVSEVPEPVAVSMLVSAVVANGLLRRRRIR
jgi:hypothetical protein